MHSVIEDEKKYFINKLDGFAKFNEGWCPGARAMSDIAISNTKAIIDLLPDCSELHEMDVAPFINGTIFITYRNGDKHMCLNVAEGGVSAISYTETDKLDTYKDSTFKPNEVDKIVEFIKNGL